MTLPKRESDSSQYRNQETVFIHCLCFYDVIICNVLQFFGYFFFIYIIYKPPTQLRSHTDNEMIFLSRSYGLQHQVIMKHMSQLQLVDLTHSELSIFSAFLFMFTFVNDESRVRNDRYDYCNFQSSLFSAFLSELLTVKIKARNKSRDTPAK